MAWLFLKALIFSSFLALERLRNHGILYSSNIKCTCLLFSWMQIYVKYYSVYDVIWFMSIHSNHSFLVYIVVGLVQNGKWVVIFWTWWKFFQLNWDCIFSNWRKRKMDFSSRFSSFCFACSVVGYMLHTNMIVRTKFVFS